MNGNANGYSTDMVFERYTYRLMQCFTSDLHLFERFRHDEYVVTTNDRNLK